jgi:hypothetical protein
MVKKQVLLLGFALATGGAAHGQNAIGEVFAGDASVRGQVLFSNQGTQVVSGSQVAAGEGAAVLKLKRGGQVRICPKTVLSLTSDASGKALALALSAGSMELDYTLTGAADAVLTPDFRLQLISPGTFHLAISVGASGDTCVHTLPGNDAAVFVAEMMGRDSYQLSPGKSVLFGGGKISDATVAPQTCGCPELTAPARVPEMAASPATSPAPASSPVLATENQSAERRATEKLLRKRLRRTPRTRRPRRSKTRWRTWRWTPAWSTGATNMRRTFPTRCRGSPSRPTTRGWRWRCFRR